MRSEPIRSLSITVWFTNEGSRKDRQLCVVLTHWRSLIDRTYLWTDEGWLYLAIVLDLFNREVVGWSLKPRMTADIVTDALTMAKLSRGACVD